MNEDLKKSFFESFKKLKEKFQAGELDEQVLFDLTAEFREVVGGRLSHYNSPIPVGIAVVRVRKDGKYGFLACKRAIEPCIGGVAFPGGYVNEGESIKEGAIRELYEEVGLVLDNLDDWTNIREGKGANNNISAFYLYRWVVDWSDVVEAYEKLGTQAETQDIVFLREGDEMCFPSHGKVHNQELAYWKRDLKIA